MGWRTRCRRRGDAQVPRSIRRRVLRPSVLGKDGLRVEHVGAPLEALGSSSLRRMAASSNPLPPSLRAPVRIGLGRLAPLARAVAAPPAGLKRRTTRRIAVDGAQRRCARGGGAEGWRTGSCGVAGRRVVGDRYRRRHPSGTFLVTRK